METMSDITKEQVERRQRAHRYESALNARITATNNIPRLAGLVQHHATQVTMLDAMLKHAENLDGAIDVSLTSLGGTVSGSVRTNLIALLAKAQADQQRRVVTVGQNLKDAQRDLKRAEDVIAELS